MSISPSFYDRDPLQAEQPTAGNDSVFVCVRVKPCDDEEQAWVANPAIGQVHLAVDPLGVGAFAFDAVVTGSGNEDIYRRAARGLVACVGRIQLRLTMQLDDGGLRRCHLRVRPDGERQDLHLGPSARRIRPLTPQSGAPNNPGLIGRAVADVFAYIRAHPNKEFLLRASYLEIYNEQLRDLLADPPALGDDGRPMPLPMSSIPRIRQDTHTKRFFVAPLREEVVTAEASVHDLLRRGEQARHVGATDLNARSSRSHTVFQLVVESKSDGVVTASSLSLIDLAGSERATSQAERRAEGAFINRSLLTLEKVRRTHAHSFADAAGHLRADRGQAARAHPLPRLEAHADLATLALRRRARGRRLHDRSGRGHGRGVAVDAQVCESGQARRGPCVAPRDRRRQGAHHQVPQHRASMLPVPR